MKDSIFSEVCGLICQTCRNIHREIVYLEVDRDSFKAYIPNFTLSPCKVMFSYQRGSETLHIYMVYDFAPHGEALGFRVLKPFSTPRVNGCINILDDNEKVISPERFLKLLEYFYKMNATELERQVREMSEAVEYDFI